LRHCDTLNGGKLSTLYSLTAEDCRQACDDNPDCARAHHHPGYQIWKEDSRTNCWLWDTSALPCNWNGGEFAKFHPGATMIECDKGKSIGIFLHQLHFTLIFFFFTPIFFYTKIFAFFHRFSFTAQFFFLPPIFFVFYTKIFVFCFFPFIQ